MIDVVDDFIGRRFGKDGQLVVIGRDVRHPPKPIVYLVKCSKCALDHEMYGDGVFRSEKGALNKGSLPCGCSGHVNWTESQYKVKVERACVEHGYIFLGLVGEWVGPSTKIKIECAADGNMWETSTVASILNGAPCPACKSRRSTEYASRPDSYMISNFMNSGSFVIGTEFWRGTNKDEWFYKCPICSFDEYTTNGLCTGVFKSLRSGLNSGCRSCRCSKTYRWTKEQRDYQIQKKLTEEGKGITYLGWETSYKGAKSKFLLSCNKHNNSWSTNLSAFSAGCRCPTCATHGYDASLKEAYVYIVAVDGVSTSFTGFGITANVDQRLAEHRLSLSRFGLSIIAFKEFKTNGKKALDIEKAIKYTFPIVQQEVRGFKTESTLSRLYEDVVNFTGDMVYSIKLGEQYQTTSTSEPDCT